MLGGLKLLCELLDIAFLGFSESVILLEAPQFQFEILTFGDGH